MGNNQQDQQDQNRKLDNNRQDQQDQKRKLDHESKSATGCSQLVRIGVQTSSVLMIEI